MNEKINNDFIKVQKKMILNIVALVACIIMLILLTMTKDMSIEILILYFFPLAELLSSIRLYRRLVSVKEPQEIIIEFKIRGFICALFLLMTIVYGISEMIEFLVMGLILYASVTEYRLKRESLLLS